MTIDTAKANIGARVAYYQRHAATEHGVITGVNLSHVYVRLDKHRFPRRFDPQLIELEPLTQPKENA